MTAIWVIVVIAVEMAQQPAMLTGWIQPQDVLRRVHHVVMPFGAIVVSLIMVFAAVETKMHWVGDV